MAPDTMEDIIFQDDSQKNSAEPFNLDKQLDAAVQEAGGELTLPDSFKGSVGVTMFDTLGSEDNFLNVLVPNKHLESLPSQALVRVGHRDHADKRVYQGIVIAGPFYEPDGLRADSAIIVSTAVNGLTFMPKYHGRLRIEVLAEEDKNGALIPPRFRPLPNSPVFALSEAATKEVLNIGGDIVLGCAIGHESMIVSIPADKKSVLPRHLGILGTTGGGKSTTISGMVNQFQNSGIATILIDTEGEYTHISQATEDINMLRALERRALEPHGIENTYLLYLAGRETTNPNYVSKYQFSLKFENLSPYAVMEVLGFTEAQQTRYLKAYDLAKEALRRLSIFPVKNNEKHQAQLLELDELEQGFPFLTLSMMYDIVRVCQSKVSKEIKEDSTGIGFVFQTECFRNHEKEILSIVNSQGQTLEGSPPSWKALQGKLGQLLRLKLFDNSTAPSFDYEQMTRPGNVCVIDLSDTDSPSIRNLVIADLLRGLMEYQSEANKMIVTRRTMVIIEEAHEFLSAQRIKQMPILFDQVARVAKRGRKRWLGLAFVTQLPQHLPDEVLALINNFILHKISDANVIGRLKRSIGNVDESLWKRLNSLSSGQAVVSISGFRRALLVAMDPTPCKLLMID